MGQDMYTDVCKKCIHFTDDENERDKLRSHMINTDKSLHYSAKIKYGHMITVCKVTG